MPGLMMGPWSRDVGRKQALIVYAVAGWAMLAARASWCPWALALLNALARFGADPEGP